MKELSAEDLSTKALELLPKLKENLGAEAAGVGDTNLLKFLLWKADAPDPVERAAGRFRAHQKWRKNNPYAYEDRPLMASQVSSRSRFV